MRHLPSWPAGYRNPSEAQPEHHSICEDHQGAGSKALGWPGPGEGPIIRPRHPHLRSSIPGTPGTGAIRLSTGAAGPTYEPALSRR